MIRTIVLTLAALTSGLAQPASAAWHKASSKHFIIYADEKPEKLREFATKLEKFDKAVRLARNMREVDAGDGNRLQVFVVRDIRTVERLARVRNAAGLYLGRASGPLAIVTTQGFRDSNETFSADIIFFHEYAHHLMLQDLDKPLPEWLIEGFAEMMSTATFDKDGAIWLGRVASHRTEGLYWGESMPLETLLAGNYGTISEGLRESVYGRGWLLAHYLYFEPSRRGQLARYVNAIAGGATSLDAARTAFGNLKDLDYDLGRYRQQRRINALRIPADKVVPPPIEIVPMSGGAGEVVLLRLESKAGVNETTAEPLAVKIRAVRARHHPDALVETTLAEAELDAGHPEASEAAADRALALDPQNTEALIYKGRAIEAHAYKAKKPDAKLLAEARSWFKKANKIDPNDPEPMMGYHRSFVEAGEMPPKDAIDGMHLASNLAPQDVALRVNSALQYLRDKDLQNARRTLVLIAYNPHGGKVAEMARNMMKQIEAGNADAALQVALGPPKAATPPAESK